MEVKRLSEPEDGKMYEETCYKLASLVRKIEAIFPELEAAQPRASGMRALCGLHWAVDKARSFLHQTEHSSKLYLVMTSDSVHLKFEKVKDLLRQSMNKLQDNLPELLSKQMALIVAELQEIACQPEVLHQEAGEKIISLLQRGKDDPGFNGYTELQVFDDVISRLGFRSNKEIQGEKKALKRLLDKVRNEDDKKKELIVLHLLHLLSKYSYAQKLASTEQVPIAEMADSCPSSPCSEASSSDYISERIETLSVKHNVMEATNFYGHVVIPPEQFQCPISLQLMADPVIICSGQTYERASIEKWFEEGKDTCPKTQQKLSHFGITPNLCVKSLISSWCERQGIPFPNPPSAVPSGIANCSSNLCAELCPINPTGVRVGIVSTSGDGAVAVAKEALAMRGFAPYVRSYAEDIQALVENLCSSSLDLKFRAAEQIRFMTKDNANARLCVGEAGIIPMLVKCLDSVIEAGDEPSQETICLALSNVAINNNRNRREIVSSGALSLILKVLNSDASLATKEGAIVALMNASCMEDNKKHIASSGVAPFLVNHLDLGSSQGIKDVLTTIFSLSTSSENVSCLVQSGVILKLVHMLGSSNMDLSEKCLAILYNLSLSEDGRSSILEVDGCIALFADMLDNGSPKEKDYIVGILLALCTASSQISNLVMEEGIISSLIALTVSGSARAKSQASSLLQYFREQRQIEHHACQSSCIVTSLLSLDGTSSSSIETLSSSSSVNGTPSSLLLSSSSSWLLSSSLSSNGMSTAAKFEKAVHRKPRAFGFFQRLKSVSFSH